MRGRTFGVGAVFKVEPGGVPRQRRDGDAVSVNRAGTGLAVLREFFREFSRVVCVSSFDSGARQRNEGVARRDRNTATPERAERGDGDGEGRAKQARRRRRGERCLSGSLDR